MCDKVNEKAKETASSRETLTPYARRRSTPIPRISTQSSTPNSDICDDSNDMEGSSSASHMSDMNLYCTQDALFGKNMSVDYFVTPSTSHGNHQKSPHALTTTSTPTLHSATHDTNTAAATALERTSRIDSSVRPNARPPSLSHTRPNSAAGSEDVLNRHGAMGLTNDSTSDASPLLSHTLRRETLPAQEGTARRPWRGSPLVASERSRERRFRCRHCQHLLAPSDISIVEENNETAHSDHVGHHMADSDALESERTSTTNTTNTNTITATGKGVIHSRLGEWGPRGGFFASAMDDPVMRRVLSHSRRSDGANTSPPHNASAAAAAHEAKRQDASPHHPPTPSPEEGREAMREDSLFPALPTFSPTSFVRAYVGEGTSPWEASLNNRPALVVSCCVASMNLIVVQFLQNHVLDTRDHLGLFAIGTYLIFSTYYMAYYFLERHSESFRRISQDKKFYTIGNLIKAGILVSLVPFATVHLTNIIVFGVWDTNTLRNLGCIYTIPDFVSMIVVKRMSWSTWTHHLCVLLFNFFSTINDYSRENVCRCVVVYAAFSTFAYCVNVLLASRFLGVPPNVARVLSFIAVVVYVFCCATNWSWQVYYLRKLLREGHDHWTVYAYMMLICLVMYDDITLNKWLLHNAKSTAFEASQYKRNQQLKQQQQQQRRRASGGG